MAWCRGRVKALTLDEMRDVLRQDPDFAVCQTILERTFETFPLEMQELPWLRGCPPLDFSVSYLAKFWCSLAWIEQVRFFYPVRNMLHNLIMFQIYRSTGLT